MFSTALKFLSAKLSTTAQKTLLNCNINKAIESAVSKLLYLYVFLLKQNINDKIKNIKDKIINI